ncbi:MAG TPA: hypothetical protein VMC85_21795 [Desulfomonilaceae bacterium]|nr:hypothetical protein [Desulfomonilaceae bacterium]HVN82982.1 hypothetical protein [Terriglobia bacterium]
MPKLERKDLFSPTVDPGRAPLDTSPDQVAASRDVEKVMVMLNPRQVNALDQVCLEIRHTTGMKFKRSMLLRALIDGFLASAPAFSEARSYQDIARKILESFQREKRGP